MELANNDWDSLRQYSMHSNRVEWEVASKKGVDGGRGAVVGKLLEDAQAVEEENVDVGMGGNLIHQ